MSGSVLRQEGSAVAEHCAQQHLDLPHTQYTQVSVPPTNTTLQTCFCIKLVLQLTLDISITSIKLVLELTLDLRSIQLVLELTLDLRSIQLGLELTLDLFGLLCNNRLHSSLPGQHLHLDHELGLGLDCVRRPTCLRPYKVAIVLTLSSTFSHPLAVPLNGRSSSMMLRMTDSSSVDKLLDLLVHFCSFVCPASASVLDGLLHHQLLQNHLL